MLSRYLYSKLHLLADTASCPAYRCERYQTSVTHVNAYSTRYPSVYRQHNCER